MRIWAKDVDISAREQVLIYLECSGVDDADNWEEECLRDLEKAYSTPLLEALPSLCPGAGEILQRVKELGCRIGLISNTGRTPGYILRTVLERFGILTFFDALTFSDELRVRKPNPKIFLHNLEQMKVRPSGVMHVGDDLRCDVGGAKGVGMRAIHLDRGEEKRADVQPDGIIADLSQLHEILDRLQRFG
jgi:putative hydrolase of the HAD superfamily